MSIKHFGLILIAGLLVLVGGSVYAADANNQFDSIQIIDDNELQFGGNGTTDREGDLSIVWDLAATRFEVRRTSDGLVLGYIDPATQVFTWVAGYTVNGVLTASNAGNVIRVGTSADLTTPPAIGGVTPNTGAFTTLSATGILTASNAANVVRIGTSSDLTTPPAIGGGTPNTGAFTTLDVTGTSTFGDAQLIEKAVTGFFEGIKVRNTGTGAGDHAIVRIEASTSDTGGDSLIQYWTGGVGGWYLGLDKSDSYTFKLSRNAIWGGAGFEVDTSGNFVNSGDGTFNGGDLIIGSGAAANIGTTTNPNQIQIIDATHTTVEGTLTVTADGDFTEKVAAGTMEINDDTVVNTIGDLNLHSTNNSSDTVTEVKNVGTQSTQFRVDGDKRLYNSGGNFLGHYTDVAEVTTTDATVTTIYTIATSSDTTYLVTVRAIGMFEDGVLDDAATFISNATFFHQGIGVSQIDTTDEQYVRESGAGTWALTFSTSGTDILVRVTGVAATTIKWGCTVDYDALPG